MLLFSLECSAAAASASLYREGKLLGEEFLNVPQTHSVTLLPMAKSLLEHTGISPTQIDYYAVSRGPGSFTGLRIGIAAVKGLAWAADKPCIGVSTLEAMAWPLAHMTGTIVCAMDARRQQIYNAIFAAGEGTLKRICPDRAISLAEAAEELRHIPGPITVVGDGWKLCTDFLMEQGIVCQAAPAHLRLQSAVGVAMAAERLGQEGQVSAQDLAPVYLRLSQAERERLAKLNQG